ncbi:Resolvase, N terminal domain [Xenorhabdus koppenhoeferi]|uniref:Resolvase, N terminal domain n=1 Tax=Xenorhabdus koppenhoeferi TaxID=351659 RepID=A0A1I7I1R6_9GAMM|nr:Resolvase, N terminal domain [Xenorhabdus koppenhoeferi]
MRHKQFINRASFPSSWGCKPDMMLDMLAAVARKDYEDRRRRQAQGVKKARQEGKYKGRPVDKKLHQKIEGLLREKTDR